MDEPEIKEPFGRSAAIVHGIALIACVVAFLAVGYVKPGEIEERQFPFVLGGVGLAAYFALALWSLILSIRSYRRQEDSAWAFSVILLSFTELLLFLVQAERHR